MEASLSNPHFLNLLGTLILFGSIGSIILLVSLHRSHPANPKALTEALEHRAWNQHQAGLVLIGFLASILLLPYLSLLIVDQSHPAARLLPTLLLAGSQLAILYLIERGRNTGWAEDFGMRRRQLRLAPLAVFICLAVSPLINMSSLFYSYLLEHYLNLNVQLQDAATLIMESRAWVKVGYVVLAVVAAPVYEELIFRGVLFPFLVKRMGLPSAITATSLTFALIHLHVPSLVPLFILSAALCLAYWRTGTLWVSIGFHAVYNGFSVIALLLWAQ